LMPRDEELLTNCCSERKEKSKENELLNKLLTNSKVDNFEKVKRKGKLITSFSLPWSEESFLLLNIIDELAKRDGYTRSNLIFQALKEYVVRHYPGNPQIPLEKFLDATRKPITMCEVEGCRGKAKYRLFLKNYEGEEKVFRVCERHKNARFGEYRFINAISLIEKQV